MQYVLTSRQKAGILPGNAAMLKTIVTYELGTAIAKSYDVAVIDTLAGFKYIAEKIAEFEASGVDTFIFSYEESYGYLAGDFVCEKDAVQIALLTAEIAAYYHEKNHTLLDALKALYESYGHYQEKLLSSTFEVVEGQKKIASIMKRLREMPLKEIDGISVAIIEDYAAGLANFANGEAKPLSLPTADVLKYILEWFLNLYSAFRY
ncbi:hypothetical protein [Lysinibacillus sp. NPDC047702]|uniref:hypothetical protein n=1 Tax=unclassified Lysinibacillus TaxID=2636778 RepID=UPI003CFDF97F